MSDPIDMTKEFSTGSICDESGRYCCKSHTYIEQFINKDDEFPKCQKANCGRTEWYKIMIEPKRPA